MTEEMMTEREAKVAGLVPVTEFGIPGRVLQTSHGEVDYGEWLRGEGRRLEALGRRTAVVTVGRRCALFATPVPKGGPAR